MQTKADIRIPTALGLGLVLLYLLPILVQPGSLALGASCGPASEQMWQMWALGANTSTHLGFPGPDLPVQIDAPVMALLFFVLNSIVGSAVLAWNIAISLGMIVLLIGTIDLGHRLSPDAPMLARLTLVLAVVGAPGWTPLVSQLGLAAVPMMFVPLAISTIDRWIHPQASQALGPAAATLAAVACSGHWTTTVFVLAIIVPMVVIQCRNIEGRQVWMRAAGALAPAALTGAILMVINAAPSNGITLAPESIGPAWIYQIEGALQLPATAVVALPALGMLLLVLAGVAARPIKTVGWMLVAAWGILLAAGLGVEGFESFAPAHQLTERVPILAHLGSWWGIAPLVAIPLGLSAMHGVEALHKVRRERLAMAVLALAMIDQILPIATADADRTFHLTPPSGVQTALSNLPEGAVLQLPSVQNGCTTNQLWQRSHGRPVSTQVRGGQDGGLQVSYLARLVESQVEAPGVRASAESPINLETFLCASADIATLQDLGFTAVVLDRERAPPKVAEDTLHLVLGPPIFEDDGAIVWSIGDTKPAESPAPCPFPKRAG